jgi:hypothetical protein
MFRIALILLYLDPGTGSLLIQFLIAGVSFVIIFFRRIRRRVKYLLYRLLRKKPEDEK